MTAATQSLERLIRLAAADPQITAAYAGGALAREEADPFGELELYLVAPDGLQPDLLAWAAPLGETAHADLTPQGCRLVTPDGLAITIAVAERAEAFTADGLKPLFNRGADGPTPSAPQLPGDLALSAGRFWDALYRAAAELGRERPFSAHGELERCRTMLVDLYRLALAPGRTGTGWAGADLLPGGGRILEGLVEWLVAPLDVKAQWRSAHRMAIAYEGLMLPLLERLGLPYPMAIRNLAFRRLDEVKPERRAEAEARAGLPEVPPAPPEAEAPPKPAGPVRVKVGKIRRPE
jgi:hypothetical protein